MSRPKRGTRGDETPRPGALADPGGSFVCVHCGAGIPEQAPGTGQRNHCPNCLWSIHADIKPGDRSSLCRAPMEPIALWVAERGEIRIIHRCSGCGVLKPNRIAGDDNAQSLERIRAPLCNADLGDSPG